MARPTLMKHPKFTRLVHILNMPTAHVRGHLEMLWDVAYERGSDLIGDSVDVEIAAGWAGEPGKFADALLTCGGASRHGFIDDDNGNYRVHDLYDHAPDYVRKRAMREQERIAKQRETYPAVSDRRSADIVSRSAENGSTPSPSPSPAPAHEETLPPSPIKPVGKENLGEPDTLTIEDVAWELAGVIAAKAGPLGNPSLHYKAILRWLALWPKTEGRRRFAVSVFLEEAKKLTPEKAIAPIWKTLLADRELLTEKRRMNQRWDEVCDRQRQVRCAAYREARDKQTRQAEAERDKSDPGWREREEAAGKAFAAELHGKLSLHHEEETARQECLKSKLKPKEPAKEEA